MSAPGHKCTVSASRPSAPPQGRQRAEKHGDGGPPRSETILDAGTVLDPRFA